MRRLILILVMVVCAVTLNAQVDSVKMVTVKDTSFIQDARLNYFATTIYKATSDFIETYNSQQKLAGKEITKKQETNQFLKKLEKLILDYQLNFIKVDTVQVNQALLEKEFDSLNKEIVRIDADPEIKHSDAKEQIGKLEIRKAKIRSQWNQIPK